MEMLPCSSYYPTLNPMPHPLISGIGHALACEFAARGGCMVYATARRIEAVGDVPPGVKILPLEVTDQKSIAAAIDEVVAKEGRIDVLVNNAGIGCVGPVAEISLLAARQVWNHAGVKLRRLPLQEYLSHLNFWSPYFTPA